MENALFSDPMLDWERRCAQIAVAGFAGVYAVAYPLRDDEFPRVTHFGEAPAQHGLELAGVYANVDLTEAPDGESGRRLIRLFEALTDVPRVELSFKCSDHAAFPAALDDAIFNRLEPLLTIAERRGLQVALYPHSFYPLETVEQADRIVRRLSHPRLGFVFPTSHVYALRSATDVASQLRECAARIASFNVCGCRRPSPPPAKCRSLPLDEGELPLDSVFEALSAGGYRGHVIVQGHGWSGDLPAKLRRCVEAFHRFTRHATLPINSIARIAS